MGWVLVLQVAQVVVVVVVVTVQLVVGAGVFL